VGVHSLGYATYHVQGFTYVVVQSLGMSCPRTHIYGGVLSWLHHISCLTTAKSMCQALSWVHYAWRGLRSLFAGAEQKSLLEQSNHAVPHEQDAGSTPNDRQGAVHMVS
jgi:hypothetical protein